MGGILSSLNSGKTSLLVNQKAIEVAGNNIANVNTPGYSRQTAELSPVPSLTFGTLVIGNGARIEDISREHDIFITRQVMDKSKTAGLENGKSVPLSELENILEIGDSSLSNDIDRFFQAWQDLTLDPGNATEREAVIKWGENLAQSFNTMANRLDTLENNIDNTLVNKIDEVNDKLDEIAKLNKRVMDIEIHGMTANGARDQRDLLLEELSFSLGINFYEESNGAVTIDLPGGVPLVQQDQAFHLQQTASSNPVTLEVAFGNITLDVNTANLGGEFRGLIDVRDGIVSDMQSDLDTLAAAMVTEINTQHNAGRDLNNNTNVDFFTAANTTAATISVAITASNSVAAGTTSAPGDGANAQAIFDLRDDALVSANTYTFSGFYGKMAAETGREVNQNDLYKGGAEDALDQAKNIRDSLTGVSIEEEMISLINYQRGFQAASQYLSTIDIMLDSLLAIKG